MEFRGYFVDLIPAIPSSIPRCREVLRSCERSAASFRKRTADAEAYFTGCSVSKIRSGDVYWFLCQAGKNLAGTEKGLAQKSPVGYTSRSGCGFEGDTIALAFQGLNSPVANPLGVAAVVVVRAGILVGRLTRQKVVRVHEDGMRHRHDRFLVPTVSDPAIARGEGSGGGANAGGEGGFDQRGAERAVAMAGPAGTVLACALVVAGTEAGPAGGMLGGGEDAHVG